MGLGLGLGLGLGFGLGFGLGIGVGVGFRLGLGLAPMATAHPATISTPCETSAREQTARRWRWRRGHCSSFASSPPSAARAWFGSGLGSGLGLGLGLG